MSNWRAEPNGSPYIVGFGWHLIKNVRGGRLPFLSRVLTQFRLSAQHLFASGYNIEQKYLARVGIGILLNRRFLTGVATYKKLPFKLHFCTSLFLAPSSLLFSCSTFISLGVQRTTGSTISRCVERPLLIHPVLFFTLLVNKELFASIRILRGAGFPDVS